MAHKSERADRLISADKVADRLGVSTRTVWAMVARGQLQKLKLGPRCTRFKEADVQRLIDQASAS